MLTYEGVLYVKVIIKLFCVISGVRLVCCMTLRWI